MQLACDRLSELSRQGGCTAYMGGGHSATGVGGEGNSETLLELLASFFALYEGLMSGGWSAPNKGLDAGALRGWVGELPVCLPSSQTA